MRILFLGDVSGRSGREAVARHLPALKASLRPDVVVVNGENAAAGYGLTMKIAAEFFDQGIACLTTGNHVWDQRELLAGIASEPRIVRPANYPENTPGKGSYLCTLPDGRSLLVVNLMARVFMEPSLDDPFAAMEKIIATNKIGNRLQILVDFHGEATSEKVAFGHNFDGRVTAVLGTHTHIPTADDMILPRGTAYISDTGMCGDYDSVIGMKKEAAIWKFTRKTPTERKSPAEGEATVCGVFICTNDATGTAQTIDPIRIGGKLRQSLPQGV